MIVRSDDADGRGGMREHLPPITAPVSLRARVQDSLRASGLLTRQFRNRRGWIGAVALAAASFAGGFLAAKLPTYVSPGQPPVARYALLLYGGLEADIGSENASRVAEYGRWAAGLQDGAKFVSGEELGRVVAVLGPPGDASVVSDPVAGFFIIDAPSEATATKIARGCPHLKYGGRVVVRSIES